MTEKVWLVAILGAQNWTGVKNLLQYLVQKPVKSSKSMHDCMQGANVSPTQRTFSVSLRCKPLLMQ